MTAFADSGQAGSVPEAQLAWQMCVADVPEPERQYCGIPGRRFRFDFAWPAERICLEVMGGVWSRGRHTRGQGYTDDCEKASLAALEGWLYLTATTEQVENGQALAWVERAFKVRKEAA